MKTTKTLCITGGMGSGKSTVARLLHEKGIPLYLADDRAKWLMNHSEKVKEKLINTFGGEVFLNNELNRPYLANIVFNDSDKLNELNHIVHPAVFKDFEQWKQQQSTPYVIKEAAILFESGMNKSCDFILTISAPVDIRVERIKERDHLSEKQIKNRLNNQMSDENREKLSDYVIHNEGSLSELKQKTNEFYHWLTKT